MKNKFIEGLKIITLGLVLGLGVGMIHATSWSYPSSSAYNTLPPINVGTDSQTKAPLYSGTTPLNPTLFGMHYRQGALSVSSLSVVAKAQFLKSVTVGPLVSGYALDVYGNKIIANNLNVTSLSSNSKLCTDTLGKLINCPLPSCNGTYTEDKYMCTGTVVGPKPYNSCTGTDGADCATYLSGTLDVLDDGQTNCANSPGGSTCCGNTSNSCGCSLFNTPSVKVSLPCSTFTTQAQCTPTGCSWY